MLFTKIKSPTLNGLNIKINRPPAKLDKLPCKAKPIAIPAAPNTAKKEVEVIPIMEPIIKKRIP